MKNEELIEYWTHSGLLDGLNEKDKILFSKNLEKTKRYLEIRDKDDRINTLAFPLIVRMTRTNPYIDAINVVEKFSSFYEEKKFLICKNYLELNVDVENSDELSLLQFEAQYNGIS